MKQIRSKLTYANVMVTILAFLVLGGGAAVAAGQLGKNTVGTKQLKRNAVTSAKVKDGSLKARDFGGPLGASVGGPPGPRGPEGPRGPSNGYQAHGESGSISGSLFGTQVVSLPVPPGSYFAVSTFEADTADNVVSGINCRLINGVGGEGSTVTTRFQSLPAEGVENVTLASHFAVSAGQSLNLQCSHTGPSPLVRVVEANIVAVQIGEFSGSGN